MLNFLRISGVILLGLGFLGMLGSAGIPFMSSGNVQAFYVSAGMFVLGWVLLIVHAIKFTMTHGWAASGITVPGMVVCSIGGAATWWFLWGPKANAYPRMYGLGAMLLTLFIASQILPRIYSLKDKLDKS
jgi:hypothetical protein